MNSKDPSKRRFMTIEQVAEELKSGDLRGLQIGGRGLWRVATNDLENYILAAYRAADARVAAGDIPAEDSHKELDEGFYRKSDAAGGLSTNPGFS